MVFTYYYSIILFLSIWKISMQHNVTLNESLFEGDILGVNSNTILRFVSARNYQELIASGGAVGHGAAITQSSAVWPNGNVYYDIADEFSDSELAYIESAIATFHQHTCIKLIKRSRQDDFILIVNGVNCASHIGRKGGVQLLSLGSHCFDENGKGSVIHEIMHAIGFFHEQSRSDRDEYIQILWHNINNDSVVPPAWKNFQKYELDVLRNLHTDYDYESIMHYEMAAFGINQLQTIKPIKPGAQIGQRKDLSKIDIQEINLLYNCNASTTTTAKASPILTTTAVPVQSTTAAEKDEICWGIRLMVNFLNFHAQNQQHCIDSCKENSVCDAISFYRANNYYYDNCFLFKSADNYYVEIDPTLQFGAWKKDRTSLVCLQKNDIIWGVRFSRDYHGFHAQNPNECIRNCNQDLRCEAITYNNLSTEIEWNCFFFNSAYNYVTDLDTTKQWGVWEKKKTSFEKKYTYEIQWGVRFMRHYIGVHVPNPNECVDRCVVDFHCEAIGYNSYSTDIDWNCFFFNSANNYVSHLDPANQWGIWEKNETAVVSKRQPNDICWGIRFITNNNGFFALNSEECIKRCEQNLTCESISYDSENGKCSFFNSSSSMTTSLDDDLQWGSWKKNRSGFECKIQSEFKWGTRFLKHHLRIHAKNVNECIKCCKADISCDAISFDNGSKYSNDNCYFFNSAYNYDSIADPTKQWGTWKKKI